MWKQGQEKQSWSSSSSHAPWKITGKLAPWFTLTSSAPLAGLKDQGLYRSEASSPSEKNQAELNTGTLWVLDSLGQFCSIKSLSQRQCSENRSRFSISYKLNLPPPYRHSSEDQALKHLININI